MHHLHIHGASLHLFLSLFLPHLCLYDHTSMNLCLPLNTSTKTTGRFALLHVESTSPEPTASGATSRVCPPSSLYSVSKGLDQSVQPNPMSSSIPTPSIKKKSKSPCYHSIVPYFSTASTTPVSSQTTSGDYLPQ